MRSIGIALAATGVMLAAGSASAQQTQTAAGQIRIQVNGKEIDANGGSPMVFSTITSSGSDLDMSGIQLTGKQREALAQLDSAHARALEAANTQYQTNVRAMLTEAQRVRFDKNQADRKQALALAQKNMDEAQKNVQTLMGTMSDTKVNGQGGQGTVMIQFGGNGELQVQSTAPSDKK